MVTYTPVVSRSTLAYIKECLETLLETDPDLAIADIPLPYGVLCPLDLIEVRHVLEEGCGIDFDHVTVRNALEHWSQFFED